MRGRIQRALSGFYYVKCADGQLYTCKARGKFRRDGISPLVGDDVEFCEVPGGEGRIDEILPRRNSFDRPSVANIDQMVIVCSQAIPKTDPYLVDRMTAIAALKEATLQAQNADVAAVSGATYTSESYVKSLQAALDAMHAPFREAVRGVKMR